MAELTSEPYRKFSFQVERYDHLHRILKKVKWKICRETDNGVRRSGNDGLFCADIILDKDREGFFSLLSASQNKKTQFLTECIVSLS